MRSAYPHGTLTHNPPYEILYGMIMNLLYSTKFNGLCEILYGMILILLYVKIGVIEFALC